MAPVTRLELSLARIIFHLLACGRLEPRGHLLHSEQEQGQSAEQPDPHAPPIDFDRRRRQKPAAQSKRRRQRPESPVRQSVGVTGKGFSKTCFSPRV